MYCGERTGAVAIKARTSAPVHCTPDRTRDRANGTSVSARASDWTYRDAATADGAQAHFSSIDPCPSSTAIGCPVSRPATASRPAYSDSTSSPRSAW